MRYWLSILILFLLSAGCQKQVPSPKDNGVVQENKEKEMRLKELSAVSQKIDKINSQVQGLLDQIKEKCPDLHQILAYGFRVKDNFVLSSDYTNHAQVTTVFTGSPAYRAGLKQGDRIHHIEYVEQKQKIEELYGSRGNLTTNTVDEGLMIIDRPGHCPFQIKIKPRWTGLRQKRVNDTRIAQAHLNILATRIWTEAQLSHALCDERLITYYPPNKIGQCSKEVQQLLEKVEVDYASFLALHKQLSDIISRF